MAVANIPTQAARATGADDIGGMRAGEDRALHQPL